MSCRDKHIKEMAIMHSKLLTMLSLGIITLAAGCAQMEQKKDLLSAAGFRVQSANTPERRESLQQLPSHELVRDELNGREVWVYADPEVCDCLYVGTSDDYQKYQRLHTKREIAQDSRAAATMGPIGMGRMGAGFPSRMGVGPWGASPYGWGAWGPWGM